MAKGPNKGVKRKGKAPRKPPKPVQNEANVEGFEREGMGVAPKE